MHVEGYVGCARSHALWMPILGVGVSISTQRCRNPAGTIATNITRQIGACSRSIYRHPSDPARLNWPKLIKSAPKCHPTERCNVIWPKKASDSVSNDSKTAITATAATIPPVPQRTSPFYATHLNWRGSNWPKKMKCFQRDRAPPLALKKSRSGLRFR